MRTSSGFEWFSSFAEHSDKAMFRKWKFEYWWTIKCKVISWTTFDDLTELVLNILQITSASAVCCGFQKPQTTAVKQKKKFSLAFKAVWHLLCAFSVRMSHDLGEETDKMSEFLSCFLSRFQEKWLKRDFQDSGSLRFSSPFLEPISADKDKLPAEPIGREKGSEFHFCFLGFCPKWSSWFLSQADWHSHTLIIIKVMLPG